MVQDSPVKRDLVRYVIVVNMSVARDTNPRAHRSKFFLRPLHKVFSWRAFIYQVREVYIVMGRAYKRSGEIES